MIRNIGDNGNASEIDANTQSCYNSQYFWDFWSISVIVKMFVIICLCFMLTDHVVKVIKHFSKIQIGFTFLVPAHPGSPGKRAVKRVCVCVCFGTINLVSGRKDGV